MHAARNLAKLVLCGVAGGLLIALAAYPGLFAFGTAAGFAGDAVQDLPADLTSPPSFQTSYVYASDGKTLITSFYEQDRRDVPLSAVAPVMQQAVVAAEDVRFYQHGGVDLKAVLRAVVADSRTGADTQGASTLTMQYVRNVLKNDPNLTPQQRADAGADTLARKLQEARDAIALEQVLTKQQILERYLNIAYFGDGAYGIYAAAQTYFSTTPANLTLPQAAMLAGIIQSPDAYNPVTGDANQARIRRQYVLNAMVGMHAIAQAQATAVAATPIKVHPQALPNDCTQVAQNSWGFFCDYFVQWWDSQPAFGLTVAQREASLKEGGWRIVTSMSPDVQDAATKASLSVYGYGDRKALPIAVVQPGTGQVLALAVNRHYSLAPDPHGRSGYPNTTNQLVAGGGAIQGYQAGSTFKMFTMLAALEQGMPLDTAFDAPAQLKTGFPDGGPGNCGGFWCPVNANPGFMDGQRTMWTGFGRSVNTYFVWLEQQVGPEKAVAMAQRLGITFRAAGDAAQARDDAAGWGSFTLGVADTTPLDLAEAYATVASGGMYCKPLPVVSITDPSGHPQSVASPQCTRAVSADVAAAAADAARCPVGDQSAYGRCDGGTAPVVSSIVGDRPVAGKTGSSEQNSTETFVGFTPQVTAAGIAADPADPADHVGSAVSHSVDVAVAETLRAALTGLPAVDFPKPSPLVAYGPGGPPPAAPPPVAPPTVQPSPPPVRPSPPPVQPSPPPGGGVPGGPPGGGGHGSPGPPGRH